MISVLVISFLATLWSDQVRSAEVQVTVDVSQSDESVEQQVTYRRGEVVAFDSSNITSTSSAIVSTIEDDIQHAGINLITATLDLSSHANQDYFDYSDGLPMSLMPNFWATSTLVETFRKLRSLVSATQMPAFIQFSGTPSAFSSELNPDYDFLCGGKGNFYPLPLPGDPTSLTQSAISIWIESLSKNISNAIWIGTQEPTHTLGFSTAYDPMHRNCSSPNNSELQDGKKLNIDRFISFWTPIAQSLRNISLTSGGVQPNAADSPDYDYVAQKIISAGMPLDYFTIQNYSPSSVVVQAAYAAYRRLHSTPAYRSVKVMMNRYGLSLSGYNYTDARGMMHYLMSESYLMQRADMLYGYSVETAALHTNGTLLPQVFKWLQESPTPLRPFTSSDDNVQGFALVQTSGVVSGKIAIWNNGTSSAAEDLSLTMTDYPRALSSANVTVLKGSGTAILPYSSKSLSIKGNTISGLSLASSEFFLLDIWGGP